jgi:hypothetical protein
MEKPGAQARRAILSPSPTQYRLGVDSGLGPVKRDHNLFRAPAGLLPWRRHSPNDYPGRLIRSE